MALHIYNSLSRQKEEFIPLHEKIASVYVCGPTVYGHAHLGHAKSYVSFDVAVKWLRHLGYSVTYIQNITDVGHLTDDADEGEDKIARQARLEKTDPMEIAQYYTRSYYDDMDRLGVDRPNIAPTATGHIPEQIALIEKLIEKGHAYEVNGNVYFSVSSFPDYGKLSGRTDQEAQHSGVRVESRSEKHHPADFALWKKADAGHIMKWNSPWSTGFPGWHTECSAMAMKYLGETIDIHGGGMENKFPHHECEIAQSEAATDKPYVRYWMHNNMVTVNGTKMGKSLKNSVNLKDLFTTVPPIVIRFFILQSHYRSSLDFSETAIRASRTGLEKLQETWHALLAATPGSEKLDTAAFEKRFADAMNDDFNTPIAISVLFDLAKAVNTALNSGQGLSEASLNSCRKIFAAYGCDILGILDAADTGKSGDKTAGKEVLGNVVSILLDLRKQARENRDFALSDLIRDRLADSGVTVKDTRDGTEWSISQNT
ncbi:MAG: cysteine--tRNA ligase [Chlorobium sp.]|nr:cysteine--tRNA ligase [Chlorobium sp.]MCW8815553.1 cysteine--tRNA ligase [Chlorobium sp.]